MRFYVSDLAWDEHRAFELPVSSFELGDIVFGVLQTVEVDFVEGFSKSPKPLAISRLLIYRPIHRPGRAKVWGEICEKYATVLSICTNVQNS